jgi:hypothetical protein
MRKAEWVVLYCAMVVVATFVAGCASTNQSSTINDPPPPAAAGHMATKYKATDGRVIEIGKSTPAEGGLSFKDPHLDKCWLADGFNFTGYDTLYIAPTISTAKVHPDETRIHEWAKETYPVELSRYVRHHEIFTNVVTSESAIKPGARTLKLENTILEYSKGGGGARFWAGMYGAGQPVLRIQGKMTDGEKTVFSYEARRSGASAGGRMAGGYLKDEDVQAEDIRSMALDLTDFMAAIAGKYQPR